MGNVELRFLGGAELLVDRAPVSVDTRKAIAIAAFLAVEDSATRDTLAALLWPEVEDERARSTLRRTLSALRSALGGGALTADRLRVALSADVSSDVAGLQDLLAETASHGHDAGDVCPDCLPSLEAAVGLYRGDFLAGFSLRDAPGFDDWARTVGEGLRLVVARALDRLAAGRAAGGDYSGAIAAASRWVELDPLHEPAHRTLMLVRAWAGHRAGAIEAYRRCVTALDEELGVAPLEETTELYEAILDEDLPPAPGIRRPVKTRPRPQKIADPTLIDREAERLALDAALDSAAETGGVFLITGEAWVGKTRLLEDFAAGASDRGHRVLLGRGYRSERTLPFGVAAQLLRAALAAGWLDPGALPAWAVSETGRLLPELEGSATPPDEWGETRLHDAITAILTALARSGTLVVAIDDSQWMDPASASFVAYLAHRIAGTAVLLVLATRGDDDGGSELITDLASVAAGVIVLEPLTAADLGGLTSDREQAGRVISATGGIPILVTEHLAAGDGYEHDVGAGTRSLVESRLAALNGLSEQVLAAATVLGGACDVDLLRVTSGRSEAEVVDALDDLHRRRVVRFVPGTDEIGLSFDAIARVANDRMSPVRRRLLHRRAAMALRERGAADASAATAAAVALHHRLGGEEAKAATWYARAADLARAVYAHAEAEGSYRAALALGHDAPAGLRIALGEVLMLSGDYRTALDEFQAAAAGGSDEVAALAEHRLGEVNRRLGRFDLAEQHFRLAEAAHPEPAALYSDWSLLRHRRGDVAGAVELGQRALVLAERSPDGRMLARAHDIVGIVSDDITHLERALELAGDDPILRMAALNSLAFASVRLGAEGRAMGLVEEAIVLARRVGDRHREAALLNHLADIHHRAGREAESQAALTDAVRLFAGLETGSWEPEVWLLTTW